MEDRHFEYPYLLYWKFAAVDAKIAAFWSSTLSSGIADVMPGCTVLCS